MAEAVQVAGACRVQVDSGEGIENLGYSVNGVDAVAEAFWIDVPGDENGGEQGPPIEIQYLGEIARVRMELSKWDSAVFAKIEARLNNATAGTPATAGTLVFANALEFRLLLNATNFDRNFPRAIPRGAIELNRGTRWARAVIEWECHKNGSGVLYNATMT
jgi:hypothetical protein